MVCECVEETERKKKKNYPSYNTKSIQHTYLTYERNNKRKATKKNNRKNENEEKKKRNVFTSIVKMVQQIKQTEGMPF